MSLRVSTRTVRPFWLNSVPTKPPTFSLMGIDGSHSDPIFQDLVLPVFAASVLTLLSSIWLQQRKKDSKIERKNTNHSKSSVPKATTKGSPNPLKSEFDARGPEGQLGSKAGPKSSFPAAKLKGVWRVEQLSQSKLVSGETLTFAGERCALLYCLVQNSQLILSYCKRSKTDWSSLWGQASAPGPFDLSQALKLSRASLVSSFNTFLVPFLSGTLVEQYWIGNFLQQSDSAALSDLLALKKISKLFYQEEFSIESVAREVTIETLGKSKEVESGEKTGTGLDKKQAKGHSESVVSKETKVSSSDSSRTVQVKVSLETKAMADSEVCSILADSIKTTNPNLEKKKSVSALQEADANMDAILGAALSSDSDSDDNTRKASASPDLDAMLDFALENSDEDKNDDGSDSNDKNTITASAVDLDDMLDDMFSEEEDDDDALHLEGISDFKERNALLLLTPSERKQWRLLLDRDKIRQQAMPPVKPLSRALTSLLAPASLARRRAEEFSNRGHTANEIFDAVFGKALQDAGLAGKPGEPVRLNMHPQQINELRHSYKDVLHVGIRNRLVRDVDFDSRRFKSAAKAFL